MSASFAAIVEALPSSSVALAASGYFTRARLRVEAERADDEAELRTRAEEVHRAAANEAKRAAAGAAGAAAAGGGAAAAAAARAGAATRSMHVYEGGGMLADPELAVIRPGRLEVWTVKVQKKQARTDQQQQQESRLVQVAEYPLWGDVQSLAVLRGSVGRHDALVICSRNLRISVIAYNADQRELRPTSLHSLENQSLVVAAGAIHYARAPMVRADPEGRCCVVVANNSIMATMSVISSDDELEGHTGDGIDLDGDGGRNAEGGANGHAAKTTNGAVGSTAHGDASASLGAPQKLVCMSPMVSSSYVKSLMSEHGIKEVLDVCFLHGYSEPVVLVLHLTQASWGGNLHKPGYRDSCAVAALSLNLSRQHHPCIWSRGLLPHDAFKLVAVPEPIGGAVVVCPHVLLHVSQMHAVAMALNPFAEEYTSTNVEAGGMPMTNAPVVAAMGEVAREQSLAGDSTAFTLYGCLSPENGEAFTRCRSFTDDGGGVRLDSGVSDMHTSWISPECCAMSVETGLLLLLTIQYDGRSVTGMALSMRGNTAIPPSAICGLGPFRMFVGSMAGDSLLIRYGQRPVQDGAAPNGDDDDAPNKRKRLEEAVEEEDGANDDDDDDDDMAFLYNKSSKTQSTKDKQRGRAAGTAADVAAPSKEEIALKVEDSLPGAGVLRDLVYGEITVASEDGQADVGLVCCGGEGNFGCLHVMRASIVPELITEIQLPDIQGVYTVRHNAVDAIDKSVSGHMLYHSYMLISLKERTMVLKTKDTLEEVQSKDDGVDFVTNEPTVLAGSVCGNDCVVQVTPTEVLLLAGGSLLEKKSVPDLVRTQFKTKGKAEKGMLDVVSADICDSLLCVNLRNGDILVLRANKGAMSFKTLGGLEHDDAKAVIRKKQSQPPMQCCRLVRGAFLSEWLKLDSDESSYFLAVCDTRGILRIHSLPSLDIVFESDAPLGTGKARYLSATAVSTSGSTSNDKKKSSLSSMISMTGLPSVKDLAFVEGIDEGVPLQMLVSYSDGTIRVYRFMRAHVNSSAEGGGGGGGGSGGNDTDTGKDDLDMLYESTPTTVAESTPILYYSQSISSSVGAITTRDGEEAIALSMEDSDDSDDSDDDSDDDDDDDDDANRVPSRMFPFTELGGKPGLSGIFVTGSHPRWFVMSRGKLLQHSSLPVGPVSAFAPLHNVHCPHGFVIVTGGALRLSQLPANVDMAGQWPVQRVAMRATPTAIAWHAESRLFAVATVASAPVRKMIEEDAPNHPEASAAQQWTHQVVRDAQMDGLEDQCAITILAPGTWRMLSSFPLEPNETCTVVKAVRPINSKTRLRESYLVVGTVSTVGEDMPVHGRLLLLELIQGPVVSGAVEACMLGIKYEREYRASVTAIAALDEYIVVSTSDRTLGTKLMVQAWDGAELMSIAFFDAPLFVTSLTVLKNFIMFIDVQKGCHFVQWKPAARVLTLLGKDFSPMDVTASEILIDEPNMSFMGSDTMGNLQALSFRPNDIESWKGQKLLPTGHVHTGRCGIRAIRLNIPVPSVGSSRPGRHAVLMSTIEGALSLIVPLEEMTFRRLIALQERLSHVAPNCAGLNALVHSRPVIRSGCTVKPPPKSNVLNAEILDRFMALDFRQQNDAADFIGSTRGQIIANLAVIQACASFL